MKTALIFLMLMNAVRGDAPLELSEDLTARAEKRAQYFCDHPLSHDGWESYLDGADYTVAGENLAKGQDGARAAHEALMRSAAHRANILNQEYERVGIGEACGVFVQFFAG